MPITSGGFPQTGRVLKLGDRWKVERATLLTMAGVECPPAPDNP